MGQSPTYPEACVSAMGLNQCPLSLPRQHLWDMARRKRAGRSGKAALLHLCGTSLRMRTFPHLRCDVSPSGQGASDLWESGPYAFPHRTRSKRCAFLPGPTALVPASAGSGMPEDFLPGHGDEDLGLREELACPSVPKSPGMCSLGLIPRCYTPNEVP